MNVPTFLDGLATACFLFAVIHTFLVSRFQHLAHQHPEGSSAENLYHLLGEVEVSFGLWAAIYLGFVALVSGPELAAQYLSSRNFTEAAFVFVIMAVCSTKPILDFAQKSILFIAKLLPFQRSVSTFATTMIVGPLLGSFITEPAAMTVTALILLDGLVKKNISLKFKYAILGLLFVNVSIGGTLTPYAAPPVLMVAAKWNWDLSFMLTHFAWKSLLSTVVSTSIVAMLFKKELLAIDMTPRKSKTTTSVPLWVYVIHLIFLGLIVLNHQHIQMFIGLFLFFLGLYTVTQEYQKTLRLREGLLVAFFLGGIVVLGEPQRWWLEPVLTRLDSLALYVGSIALTSVTDNAALAYLGSQISSLSDASKFSLVAGSVVGGGLTVIANAPNPVGYGLLNPHFGEDGINPIYLALAALPFTIISALILWLLSGPLFHIF